MFNKLLMDSMKKMILALAAVVFSAGLVSAQDLASATETYNNGAEQFQNGDKVAALDLFKKALTMAEALGDDGADIVANCKNTIPVLTMSIAKDLVREKEYDSAIEKINEAQKVAGDYENDEVIADAAELLPQVLSAAGTAAYTAKEMEKAVDYFEKSLALDTDNGATALRLGQALNSLGKVEEAKAAFTTAMNNGQEDNAKKQLANIILREAQAALQAGKNADVVSMIAKADEDGMVTNAAAYQLAASASQKLNKAADAIKYYEKFLSADPDNKNAGAIAYTVGALYQGQNNKAKALEFYKKAQEKGYAQAADMVKALSQ